MRISIDLGEAWIGEEEERRVNPEEGTQNSEGLPVGMQFVVLEL